MKQKKIKKILKYKFGIKKILKYKFKIKKILKKPYNKIY